ncbi:MAG: response regulator [Verrucomicrobia bacterium]|nr:response regulator [Verrucomicrobiota bacterium]
MSTGTVLVADDDPISRGAITSVLRQQGFACMAVESAEEALATLRQRSVDLIVSDICMPGNAGLEMVQLLSLQDDAPPIILVTGQPTLETAMQAVRLRVFDYLLKPVDPGQLVSLAEAGIASRRTLQLLRTQRDRLRSTLAEMDRCEEIARTSPGRAANAALVTFLGVSVQQSLSTIADIGTLAEAIVSTDRQGEAQRRLQSARPVLLVEAIRETIHTLEQTKGSFKSRELGDLRKRLEHLIGNDSAR